jgi:trehalose 6-phosphate synthase/phosphatase
MRLSRAGVESWKDAVRPILVRYVDRTPGSLVEEKDVSLAWHYRVVPTELAGRRRRELIEALGGLAHDLGLSLLDGNKVVEVTDGSVDKGKAAYRWMGRGDFGFIMAVGDDVTDESVFDNAPPEAWTIKVGSGASGAVFHVPSTTEVRSLLEAMVEMDAD